MSACDDFRASFGEDIPICWLCQALKERDEAIAKRQETDLDYISAVGQIQEAWKERDAAREELGWKRLCPKCEEHYSDPNDLGECPVCETQARNNRLSEMLQEIWDAAEQETGGWRDVGAYFAKLRKERDEARAELHELHEQLEGDTWAAYATRMKRERDAAQERLQHAVEREEMWEAQRDEARAVAREYFEASLHEVVGRSCYAEVVEEAYKKYPFLKEMPLDP